MFGTGPRNIHGALLSKIDTLCDQDGLPRLRTLVVLASDGLPSGGWAGFDTAEEKRAAQGDCYKHFGSTVPESVSRLRRRSSGATASAEPPPPRSGCPTCGMELSPAGECIGFC